MSPIGTSRHYVARSNCVSFQSKTEIDLRRGFMSARPPQPSTGTGAHRSLADPVSVVLAVLAPCAVRQARNAERGAAVIEVRE